MNQEKQYKEPMGGKKLFVIIGAVVIHLASLKNKVSQLKTSEISGISAVTIRDRSKEITKCIGGEI